MPLEQDALPGRNDPGGIRPSRFHGASSCSGTEAESQAHTIPWRPRTEPSLARLSHYSKAWQRCEANVQWWRTLARWTAHRYELGSTAQARVQYRHWRLRSLRWFCQSHRLYWRPGHHWQDIGSSSQEGARHSHPPVAHTSSKGTPWDIASFRWKGIQFNSIQSARKPLKKPGSALCVLQFRNERMWIARSPPQTKFQANR